MSGCFLTDPTFWQIVGSIATAGALIFTMWQNRYIKEQTAAAIKSYEYNCGWQEKEKATELAKFYADQMMPKIGYINVVSAVYRDLLVEIKDDEMSRFTLSELQSLTSKNIYEGIHERIQKCDIERFQLARTFLPTNMKAEFTEAEDISIALYAVEFEFISSQLLNELEYFSMCFTSGVADETIVYQSLHQTFFSTIKMLYYKIAVQNNVTKDKYYTHTIKLYKQWRDRDKQNERQQAAAEEQMTTVHTAIKK
jgi:hypothetical protein